MTARYTPTSKRDLLEIAAWIARDNPERARSFVEELRVTCRALAHHPESAIARSDLLPGLRCRPHGAYLIFYRPLPAGVLVIRILHGARDVAALLPPSDGTAPP